MEKKSIYPARQNMHIADQLKNIEWTDMRAELYVRSGLKCEMCGYAVNFKTIKFIRPFLKIPHDGRLLWQYEKEDYIVVCKECKAKIKASLHPDETEGPQSIKTVFNRSWYEKD